MLFPAPPRKLHSPPSICSLSESDSRPEAPPQTGIHMLVQVGFQALLNNHPLQKPFLSSLASLKPRERLEIRGVRKEPWIIYQTQKVKAPKPEDPPRQLRQPWINTSKAFYGEVPSMVPNREMVPLKGKLSKPGPPGSM